MGLFDQIGFSDAEITHAEPTSAPAPALAPAVTSAPAPVKRNAVLTPKRNAHGLIESVTGYNRAGEKVTFEFQRDGRRSLQQIKVK